MKRSLCAAFLFMTAALIALPAAFIRINSEKENIVITEKVISGDPGEAAGVSLQIATHWRGHLLWDTEYTIGSGEGAESTFEFSSDRVIWRSQEREYILADIITGFGTVSGGGSAVSSGINPENMWLSELIVAVAERTSAGKVNRETVRLRDYYRYYPISFEVRSIPGNLAYYVDEEDFYTDFFHMEVPENHWLDVTVEKNDGGEIISVDCSTLSGGITIDGVHSFGEKGCYYVYNCGDMETGEVVDVGQNSGIFYLPYAEDGNGPTIVPEQMRKVCGVPEGMTPVEMLLDEDEGRLYLAARDGEGYSLFIYRLDGEIPVLTRQISVFSEDTLTARGGSLPHWSRMTPEEGGILIKWQDNNFAFVAETDGGHQLWCSGVFPSGLQGEADSLYSKTFRWEHACLFDGERLVLAAFETPDSVNVLVAVYGPEGETYCGVYEHSAALDALPDKIEPQGAGGSFGRDSGYQLRMR